MLREGVCRWCGCTYDEPCLQGCAWVEKLPPAPLTAGSLHYVRGPLEPQTLCTACVDVEQQWRVAFPLPNMRRAYFRGFMVGADDERREALDSNPYARSGQSHSWWQRGLEAGRRRG